MSAPKNYCPECFDPHGARLVGTGGHTYAPGCEAHTRLLALAHEYLETRENA